MKRVIAVLCILLCTFCLFGCSSANKEEREAENAAQTALAQAQNLYESEEYDRAARIAKSIITDFPETTAVEDAQKIIDDYVNDLFEQEKEAYAAQNWSLVISLNDKIVTAVPHTDIAEKSQEMAQEARNAINKELEENEAKRAEERAQQEAEREQKQQELFSSFRSDYDQVTQITWYRPSSAPEYINNNSCYIYMGKNGGDYPHYWIRWVMSYAGNDWIFFDNITINVDGTNYYKTFDYFDVNRDNNYGGVWEYVDISVTSNDMEILDAIANSDQTIIRFQGDEYRYDKTVTQTEKDGIRSILDAYEIVKNQRTS